MDLHPLSLLFLDEDSRHAAHALNLHRFRYRCHFFPHPSSPAALPEDLAPRPPHPAPRQLPWTQMLAALAALPPGPVVVVALSEGGLLKRLPVLLERMTQQGREVHLVLGDWVQYRLGPSLVHIPSRTRSLILLPSDQPEASLAPCLEDLHLWLRSTSSTALRGPWIWQGTPASSESIEALTGQLAALLARRHPSSPEETLAHFCHDAPPLLLSAHLPLAEETELHESLRQHGWDAQPLATGRCCPERLRHSLRLGAFLSPAHPCEASDAA